SKLVRGSRSNERARLMAWNGARKHMRKALVRVSRRPARLPSGAVAPFGAMPKPSVTILEWVRYPNGVWNLPRRLAHGIADAAADVRLHMPETRSEADALLPEADVVLGFAVRPENFARCERLRWIHSTAASVTGVLFPELVASPVIVTNARGLHADA